MSSEPVVNQKLPKLIRNFPQTQPVADSAVENKQRLSKNILAGVSDKLSYDLPIFCLSTYQILLSLSCECEVLFKG